MAPETPKMQFVSLHSHTTYSYLDGFGQPLEHVKRVAELGMKAVAFTEHGNVSSHVKLERAALQHGIKPIFGLEAYCAPPSSLRKSHMTLLAMTQGGYQNLTRLTTRSWADFYRWPTVHGENLRDNSKGLIALSGCSDSMLNNLLYGGKDIEPDFDAAVRLLRSYKRMFGNRFFLETQRFPQLERTCDINAQYAVWSSKYDIPLAATADVHYPLAEQARMQQQLHAIGRGHGVGDGDWEYDIALTYPTSDNEIRVDLMNTGLSRSEADEAIANTARIADRCNVELPKMKRVEYPITEKDLQPWT